MIYLIHVQLVRVQKHEYELALLDGEKNTQRVLERGSVVLVTESRPVDDVCFPSMMNYQLSILCFTLQSKEGNVVVKGSPEKLVDALLDSRITLDDPNYVSDFLLTFRTFASPIDLGAALLARIKVVQNPI